MSMNVGSGGSAEQEVMIEMNATPLIDVMLVLLIMLILTIPIQNDAVNLNMPVGTPPPSLVLPEVVTIDVDFDGAVIWNGTILPNRSDWESKLQALGALPIAVVEYKAVAAVLATAQRMGVTKIGLVGNEQFMQ